MSPGIVREPCPSEQELLRQIVAVMDQILDLGTWEIAALTNGKSAEDLDCIGQDLDGAMNARMSLINQYKSHVRSHRCK